MILCGSQVFPAADLPKLFPVLTDMAIEFEGSQGLIGGFGLSGNICEQCLGALGEGRSSSSQTKIVSEKLYIRSLCRWIRSSIHITAKAV